MMAHMVYEQIPCGCIVLNAVFDNGERFPLKRWGQYIEVIPMAKQKKTTIKKYRVIHGIEHRELKVRYEPGAVVNLGPEWDIAGFLACGAIVVDDESDEVAEEEVGDADEDTIEIPTTDFDTGGW